MRRAIWLPFVWLVAACGGSRPAEPSRAPPDPVATFEEHAARIHELSERGCACTDRRCLGAIDRELAELVTSLPATPVAPGELERGASEATDALKRLSVCLTDRQVASPAYGAALLPRFRQIRHSTCACTDLDCARAAMSPLAPEIWSLWWFPIEAREMEEINRESMEMKKCMDGWSAPTRAFHQLEALRAAACVCADADCAAQVQADFDAFLEEHKDTKGSDKEALAIGELARAMAACLAVARGE